MAHGFTTKELSVKRVRDLLPPKWRGGRARIGAITLVLFALAMPACQRPTGQPDDARRPLEMLVTNDAETLDPRYVTDFVGMRTSRLLHAGLTRLDDSLRPVPYLAASLEWEGPLTLHVTLRQGLHFHGGAAFTSEDVVATLHAFADPVVASRHVRSVEAIESVVADGPYDVRIVLRRAHATLLSDLDLPILRHDQAVGPPDPSGTRLDGMGPFELVRSERGDLLLHPSRFGFGGPAHHDLVIRTVHDENARALRLYSGRADLAQNAISPTLLPALDGHEDLTVATTPGANLTYLVVRVERGALADVRLRRAISLGIDRRTIAESLFGGHAQPADTVLPPGHWASAAGNPPLVFDAEQARALVRAIGLGPIHLTLLTSTDRLRLTVARTMAQELGDVGLDVEVVPLELGTLIARLNAGDFDIASLQMPELTEPNTLRVFLHSGSIPPAGSNRGRVRDAELDRLLDLGDEEPILRARGQIYGDVEKRLRQEMWIVPLWHEDQVAVVSGRAKGFRPTRDGRWLGIVGVE
jgi:peptide/nickel transport system substrate-binding protein